MKFWQSLISSFRVGVTRAVARYRGNPVLYLILLIVLINGVFLISLSSPKPNSLSPAFSTDFAYDNRTFLPAIAQYQIQSSICRGTPGGCPTQPSILVLPHHLLASPLIAQAISLLAPAPPKTIIILSPNHANIGQCDIASSQYSWDTPFGQVEVDRVLLSKLLETNTICLDDEALAVEHGIAGLLPFVKYYLPNTKIIPLALKKDPEPFLFDNFVRQLISTSNEATILSSVDFSHGLSQKEAQSRDSITEKLISSLDYTGLLKLSSEFIDSPASLVASLKILESQNSPPKFLAHSDSSAYNGSLQNVTSYYLITGGTTATNIETSNPASPSLRGGTPTWQSSSSRSIIPAKAGIHSIVPNSSETFTLLFAGDVMLGRSVNTRILKYSDFSWPFRKISSLLSDADLTLVNLESPFRSGCKPTDGGMVFCADPRSVEGLKTAGIDIVNLANNHINNQGQEGILETMEILNKNNISFVGARRDSPETNSAIYTIKNTKIAFLGFTDIPSGSKNISTASPDNIKKQVSEAKKVSDLVIATFHWGNEYSSRSLRQQELAHIAIDSGADAIIGHHPHWVQEIEEYKDKPIYYSLGNLVFDQMWSEETRKGLVVKLTFSGSKLVKQEQFPIKIFDYGQPTLIPEGVSL